MLISLAVDHQAADVATRERFHLAPDRLKRLYTRLADSGVAELALLGTCNRTELHAWCPNAREADLDQWHRMLARRWMRRGDDVDALMAIAVRRSGLDAARHAIRVAVGLESLVLGDGQILGQFRVAYREASEADATGPVLHRLFETALRAGKRVQTETLLRSGTNSVGAQAAALAARRFGNLTHTRIVIVGCGKTGERTGRQLAKFGARDLVFLNRSPERAITLAAELGGRQAPLEALNSELAMADIAIVATGSATMLVHADELQAARAYCATAQYPLLLIDLSMPRNIDPAAAAMPGVTLVDLDALRPQVMATEQTRREAVPAAEDIVEVELQQFSEWLSAAAAREAIRPLREALADVCRREVAYATDDATAERVADRIVAKVLALPMTAVRGALARGDQVTDISRAIHELFTQPVSAPSVPALSLSSRIARPALAKGMH